MQSGVVTIICPNLRCRSVLQVPEAVRGQRVRCGKCSRDFIVPQAPTRLHHAPPPKPVPPPEAPKSV